MKKQELTKDQHMLTAGFLGVICLGMTYLPRASPVLLASGMAAFGTGMSSVTAYYRVGHLFKDGQSGKNNYMDGFFAGVAVLTSMAGCFAAPFIVDAVAKDLDYSKGAALTLGLIAAAVGFIQGRSTIIKDMATDMERTK